MDCCKTVVGLEDKFIDLAFEAGEIEGMTPDDIKRYIRFIADWRLRQLELPTVYGIEENPLPWLQSLLSGVEHANFFEARSTEYSKAATTGQWQGGEGVWAEFDRLMARRGEPAPAGAVAAQRLGRHAGAHDPGPARSRHTRAVRFSRTVRASPSRRARPWRCASRPVPRRATPGRSCKGLQRSP